MDEQNASLFVVDDDPAVVRSIERLLKSANYVVETFISAQEFLDEARTRQKPACVVLDVQMPGLSGLELQAELQKIPASLSIVFITGHGDIPMGVRAIKSGAVDFLPKPVGDTELLDAIQNGLRRANADHASRVERSRVASLVASLTPRERQVMTLVVAGRLNKQIAFALGTVEKTVKVQRARVMEKMKIRSVAELVRMLQSLDESEWRSD